MRIALFLLSIVFLVGCHAEEDNSLGKLFFERSVEGGILISLVKGNTEYVYNADRMETPYSPDSTFYIIEALIALQEKVVADEKQPLPWDGEDRGLAEWNRDQTLETAYKYSCLWAGRQLAERIGLQRFSKNLKAANYGNGEAGKGLESFWLTGDLEITGRQQAAFLRSLYLEELPFNKTHQRTVKQWMIVRKTKTHTLYAKTAWASHSSDRHGWDIGFVETKNKGAWIFALNIKIEQAQEASFRQEIVDEALRLKGIIQ
jgi:beta-lactamase class D